MNHHPLIAALKPFEGWIDENLLADCTGCLLQRAIARPHHHPEFFTTRYQHDPAHPGQHHARTTPPAFGEEYFEWIDLLESIAAARGRYIIMELGAGFGRWGVRAYKTARQAGLQAHTTLAEADPAHLTDLRHFLTDNMIPNGACTVVEAAIGADEGTQLFHVTPEGTGSSPRDEYGQMLIPHQLDVAFATPVAPYHGVPLLQSAGYGQYAVAVATQTLNTLLAPHEKVDLINMDIQGHEGIVVAGSLGALNRKVKRLHISTHSAAIERDLFSLLLAEGWKLNFAYGCKQENSTPYGRFAFVDGRQSWNNPHFS